MTSHPLYLTSYWCYFCHHIHSIDDITPNLFMTSHPIYICRHHTHCIQQHIHYIVPSQRLYLCLTTTLSMISHPLYIWHLTHYIWYHSHCICLVTPALLMPSQKLWKSSHWHTHDIIHSVYHISFTLYEINPQYLLHHKHCIHDIRSPLYDITSTL